MFISTSFFCNAVLNNQDENKILFTFVYLYIDQVMVTGTHRQLQNYCSKNIYEQWKILWIKYIDVLTNTTEYSNGRMVIF